MPSASNKSDNKASAEAFDPIKQVITVIEKKVRNLEKRKGKLDQYRTKAEGGETLNKDQQDAIQKYDSVINNLEFARELQKQFIGIGTDIEKLQRKQAKREKIERHTAEMKKVQEILKLQALLDNMGTESVREDFQAGKNGAIQLSAENLDQLDNIYKLVSPTREGETSYEEQLSSASDHLVSYFDAREKDVVGTTYKDLRELVQKIHDCQYFDNLNKEEAVEEVDEEKKDEGTEKVEESEMVEQDIEETVDDSSKPTSAISPNEVHSLPPVAMESPDVTQQQQVSHQPPQQEVMSSVVPPEADPAVVVAAAQDLVGMVAPPNFAEQDDSFFSTASAYAGNRAFTEIVSSVQGTFNFLQDSHIESQTPHIDPAVVVAQPMGSAAAGMGAASLSQSSASVQGTAQSDYLSSSTSTQQQVDSHSLSQSQTNPDTSPQQQQQLDYSTVITGLDFGQNQISNTLQNSHNTFSADQSQATLANQMAALSTDQSVISTPDVPPSIPLPNQGSLSTDSQSQEVHEKKHYMNPNAVTFQSMYSQPSSTMAPQSHTDYQQEPPQTSSSSTDSKYDYQSSSYGSSNYGQSGQQGGYGSYSRGGGGSRGGRGSGQRDNMGRGGRAGSSGPGGMSNGYNQRGGGSGGGRSNNSYPSNRGSGGGSGYSSNRGTNNRGGFQGYPPRSDYQPEGGYQGYSNGFTSSGFGKRGGAGAPRGSTRGSSGGGMRGGGGPRGGGGMRGGGGRGGYSSQRSSQQ